MREGGIAPFESCDARPVFPKKHSWPEPCIFRVGQNRICTSYMTVCMVIFLLKLPYIHRIYICMYGFGQPYVYTMCLWYFWQ